MTGATTTHCDCTATVATLAAASDAAASKYDSCACSLAITTAAPSGEGRRRDLGINGVLLPLARSTYGAAERRAGAAMRHGPARPGPAALMQLIGLVCRLRRRNVTDGRAIA